MRLNALKSNYSDRAHWERSRGSLEQNISTAARLRLRSVALSRLVSALLLWLRVNALALRLTNKNGLTSLLKSRLALRSGISC